MEPERYNTELKRYLAAIVDALILMPVGFVINALVRFTDGEMLKLILQVIAVFLPVLYSTILHYRYGQTLGKVVFSLLVLDEGEEHKLSLVQAVMRNLIPLLFATGFTVYYLYRNSTEDFEKYYEAVSRLPLTVVGELFSMAVTSRRRAIHGYLAGSVVIRLQR